MASAAPSRSAAAEWRLALGEERLDAFAVIGGVEAREAFVPFGRRELDLGRQPLDELLVPARDERGTAGDALRGLVCGALDLLVGHDAVHEPFLKSFRGAEHAPFEQDLERDGAPREREQALQLAISHREAEAVHRHAEAARLTANAQVAHGGDLEPAADARAFDQRDGGMPALR